MRRSLIAALLVAALSPFSGASQRRSISRLEGVWRSDKEKTLQFWQFKEGTSTEAKEKVSSWFGSLTHTFRAGTLATEFEGQRWVSRYKVLSSTENTVTIEYAGTSDPPQTWYFEGEYMFLRVGLNREFFRRVAA